MNWNAILNWQLRRGSHVFPGPDGGTCINEAAIVAAGFEYRAVGDATDCPPCFSLPLSHYALVLNDSLPNRARQKLLMPFVTRLAGTADTPDIEVERMNFIVMGLIKEVLPIALGKHDLAAQCAAVTNRDEASAAVQKITNNAVFSTVQHRAFCLARCLDRSLHDIAINHAFDLSLKLPSRTDANRSILYLPMVSLLDGAMKIGRQAEPIEYDLVVKRLTEIRQPQLADCRLKEATT